MSTVSRLKTLGRKAPVLRRVYSAYRLRHHASYETYEPDFAEFLARERGTSVDQAQTLIEHAQEQFSGGWAGDAYREFTERALETLRPLYDDRTDAELLATYRYHGPIDFLRMIGYVIPKPREIEPIVSRLASKASVDLVDYGCGLAHRSIAVSRRLIAQGKKVRLTLIDIHREHHVRFLNYVCGKYGIEHTFLEVTPERIYPELPPHDYNDNVSVLEHVRDPLTVVENTDRALRPGGLYLAYIADSVEEMMHISPDLSAARRRLDVLGYREVARVRDVPLLQKPS